MEKKEKGQGSAYWDTIHRKLRVWVAFRFRGYGEWHVKNAAMYAHHTYDVPKMMTALAISNILAAGRFNFNMDASYVPSHTTVVFSGHLTLT